MLQEADCQFAYHFIIPNDGDRVFMIAYKFFWGAGALVFVTAQPWPSSLEYGGVRICIIAASNLFNKNNKSIIRPQTWICNSYAWMQSSVVSNHATGDMKDIGPKQMYFIRIICTRISIPYMSKRTKREETMTWKHHVKVHWECIETTEGVWVVTIDLINTLAV